MDTTEAVEFVCALAQKHARRENVERARTRQGAVLAWKEPDYLPFLVGGDEPELAKLPTYDWKEQFDDPAKSFVEQMKGVVSAAAGGADRILGLRADTGVINGPSIFPGVEYQAPAHTKPVVSKPATKEALQAFKVPDDISGLGVLPRMIEHTQHHLGVLKAHGLDRLVDVHHCDTQGPFDIAAQARGHEIFPDIYEDPEFISHLLGESTKVYIRLSRLCKRLNGEGNWGNASGYWMSRGGVRMCEDSSILVSRKTYEAVIKPRNEEALAAFGAGWIHYCGSVRGTGRPGGEHLHDTYVKTKGLRGLNFTTAGDLAAEIRKLVTNKVAYIGGVDREPAETLETYFNRVLSLLPKRTGLLLENPVAKPEELPGGGELWCRVQDKLFPR